MSQLVLQDPSEIVVYEEEVVTEYDCGSNSPIGYELTDTKCFRTPSGVQKTATIGREFLPGSSNLIEDGKHSYLDEEVVNSEFSEKKSDNSENIASTSSATPDYSSPMPLRRMAIRIGNKTLRFKVINASDAPEGPDNPEPNWLTNTKPISEPKSLAGLFHCANCKTYFGNREVWQRHMTEVHGDPRPYRCFNCGMRFANKNSMTLHLKEHSLLRPAFECEYCSRTFSKVENRNNHQKMHVVRFSCQFCSRFFRSREQLNVHLSTRHITNAPNLLPNGRISRFSCNYCGAKFYYKKDLAIHERVHTGEKPYSCGYCDRSFSQSQSLTIHIRTHTNEFPYPCSICDRKFRDSSSLRKHELNAHTAEPVTRPLYRIQSIQRAPTTRRVQIIHKQPGS